jgi:hypothetical protein
MDQFQISDESFFDLLILDSLDMKIENIPSSCIYSNLTYHKSWIMVNVCMAYEDSLGNAVRHIFVLLHVINVSTTSGRLIPDTITSTGIVHINLGV